MASITGFFQTPGRWIVNAATNAWQMFEFSVEVFLALLQFFRRQGLRAVLRVTAQQVYFTGLEALPFLSLLALLLGFTVIAQSLP